MNIIFGHANPSGKLTFTIPKEHSEQGWTKEQYDDDTRTSVYTEKHHFGYRWYDQHNVEPAYPFGHGLSYAKFKYMNLKVDKNQKLISFDIENEGEHIGSEIA